MQDIDTALLRTFLALAELKSFSRTAARVGRSQSAVSAQIQKLEQVLGQTLFDRDKRNVRLTHDGEKLIGYARQMVQLADAMLERFHTPEVEGEVRFGAPEDFTTRYMPEILAAFADAFPKVFLNVSCDLTLHLLDGYAKNAFDLIVIKQDPASIHQGASPLWKETLVWVGGPRFDPHRSFAEIAHGQPLPLVVSPPPCVYRHRATTALDAAGLPWKVAYASPSFAGAAAAVQAGLGVAVLPRTMIPDGTVVFEEDRGWPKLRDAVICLLATQRPSAATAALARFIQERMATYRKSA